MVYCSKCGQQNADEATYCSSCGTTLKAPQWGARRKPDVECSEECSGGPRSDRIFWGVILALVGLWILFEFGLKNISGMPQWVYDFQFWWIIPVIIGLAIIVAGLRMVLRPRRPQ
ncbi:MAG: zinc-ribbon domain-containing protein [Thermoplasmata archaeon]